MVQTIDMPSVLTGNDESSLSTSAKSLSYPGHNANTSWPSSDMQRKESLDRPTPTVEGLPGAWPQTPGGLVNGNVDAKERHGGKDGNAPNGGLSERAPSTLTPAQNTRSRRSGGMESDKKSGEVIMEAAPRPGAAEEGYFTSLPNGKATGPPRSPLARPTVSEALPTTPHRSVSAGMPATSSSMLPPVKESSPAQPSQQGPAEHTLKPPSSTHRASSPPAFSQMALAPTISGGAQSVKPSRTDRLTHRHTLEVPPTTNRTSADGRDVPNGPGDAAASTTGRYSPTTPTRRRASLQLTRRTTRSIHSDMQLDHVPQDDDAARWTEIVKAKRASKKQRADTDDDRVLVGHKVDEHHDNYIKAYNMLTGIRFCVSRIHAKIDRDITEADFTAKHKYSFDITGGELTPSAKYDFKFKDYAPWVFRHIRAAFRIDPADYLVSLTAKYILSELGSPGKSGSFFYFSRDYKYIIKTIHHGEHKFLRKILRDYYEHVLANPNTLLSQFYGLHRVKLPYGKKVHFVVMNNLFPPHRDIHRTFDLKGSTIGRDFHEEDLKDNPRATLKDLNWLRRNLHLEFGPAKKDRFVQQMQRDVALLQRLKIMDYSLLVGIHDLERGNEENLRDKTLQVFEPGKDKREDPQMGMLMRTPSKMESAKRARELRATVKKERPVPLAQTIDKMPDEAHRKGFYFYSDDGGFRATHEDDMPGEEIYYLGIIDCLTRYNMLKKAEHFWKGMGGHESQISPIPPDRYGDRFVRFISGITMSRERAEKERLSHALEASIGTSNLAGLEGTIEDPRLGGVNIHHDKRNPSGTQQVMDDAHWEADESKRQGADEDNVPDRQLTTVRSPGDPHAEAATLPVIGEAAENGSIASRTPSNKITPSPSNDDVKAQMPVLGDANMPSESLGEVPPPTPPKTDGPPPPFDLTRRESWGGGPPPTPPKDDRRGRAFLDKSLPLPPKASKVFSTSPSRMDDEEMHTTRVKLNVNGAY